MQRQPPRPGLNRLIYLVDRARKNEEEYKAKKPFLLDYDGVEEHVINYWLFEKNVPNLFDKVEKSRSLLSEYNGPAHWD